MSIPIEVISANPLIPQRLFALIQLVRTLGGPTKDEILETLQPAALVDEDSRDVSRRLYKVALDLTLIQETEGRKKCVKPAREITAIQTYDDFRELMQRKLTGATSEGSNHYLLNLIAAWYAVQDEQVLSWNRAEISKRLNEQMFSDEKTTVVSEDPMLTTWPYWAELLGWGWSLKLGGGSGRFIPDATARLSPLIPRLLAEKEITMSAFMSKLADLCPELDGGVLFERCRAESQHGDARGHRLSLMLSTALRVLHGTGKIELIERPDAPDKTVLYDSQSFINFPTHIRRGDA